MAEAFGVAGHIWVTARVRAGRNASERRASLENVMCRPTRLRMPGKADRAG